MVADHRLRCPGCEAAVRRPGDRPVHGADAASRRRAAGAPRGGPSAPATWWSPSSGPGPICWWSSAPSGRRTAAGGCAATTTCHRRLPRVRGGRRHRTGVDPLLAAAAGPLSYDPASHQAAHTMLAVVSRVTPASRRRSPRRPRAGPAGCTSHSIRCLESPCHSSVSNSIPPSPPIPSSTCTGGGKMADRAPPSRCQPRRPVPGLHPRRGPGLRGDRRRPRPGRRLHLGRRTPSPWSPTARRCSASATSAPGPRCR